MSTNTGLFAVDGIDVAGLIAEHLGPRVLPGKIIRPGAILPRDPDNLTTAPARGDPTEHPFRGFVEDFSTFSIDGSLIKAGDRKVVILGRTLPTGVEPDVGPDKDQIEIEGTVYTTHRVLSRDPAGAAFVIQVR